MMPAHYDVLPENESAVQIIGNDKLCMIASADKLA
jgi:hypothetical protein